MSPFFAPRHWNYGPLSFDRTHTATLFYTYELPSPGRVLQWRPIGLVADHWAISGVTRMSSGGPFTPGLTTTDGQDITGTPSEYARLVDLYPNNPPALRFGRPKLYTFGNVGVGSLRGCPVSTTGTCRFTGAFPSPSGFPANSASRELQYVQSHPIFRSFHGRDIQSGRPAGRPSLSDSHGSAQLAQDSTRDPRKLVIDFRTRSTTQNLNSRFRPSQVFQLFVESDKRCVVVASQRQKVSVGHLFGSPENRLEFLAGNPQVVKEVTRGRRAKHRRSSPLAAPQASDGLFAAGLTAGFDDKHMKPSCVSAQVAQRGLYSPPAFRMATA